MKQNIFKKMAAFLSVGMLLTACSQDSLVSEPEVPVDKDSNFYINVEIASPSEQTTRANDNESPGDYEQGSVEEGKVHNILFIFYNTSNKYVGSTEITFNSTTQNYEADGEAVDASTTTETADGTVETIMNITVPVTVSAGSLKPAYVMAIVNPTTDGADEQRSFEQFIGITRELEQMTPQKGGGYTFRGTEIKEHNGFTMSNSVYYEQIDGNRPKIAVDIPDDCLYNSADEAKAATGDKDKKVKIYVERVVAKVTVAKKVKDQPLEQTNNKIKDVDGVEYTLDFEDLAWGLSNVEKGTFLVKNFRTQGAGNCEGADFDTYFPFSNMLYSAAKEAFRSLGAPSWNFKESTQEMDNWGISGFRSFWAMSPTYFPGGKYPAYSDEVVDVINGLGEGEYDPYSLHYYSFDDIYNTKASGPNKLTSKGKALGGTLYALEHTMMPEVITNQQKRGVTCALIIGQYSLKKNGVTVEGNPTFYIRNGLNSSGETVKLIYASDKDLMAYILNANNKIFVRDASQTSGYKAVDWNSEKDLAEDIFMIDHPSKSITDNKYTPNRYVSLHFKTDDDGKLTEAAGNRNYYLRDSNGTYTLIDDSNIEAANTALYGLVNGVEKYQSGYAFFAVPIEHLWRQTAKIGDNNFTPKLGQYGIVRNHLYTIEVQSIGGIGTGIGDTTVPIIPNVEQEKYFVKTQINVQRWRVVPKQNIVLQP